ncbi:MAG: cyclic nucleotide-binding domain-containing protein [Chloroflexota bacterium]
MDVTRTLATITMTFDDVLGAMRRSEVFENIPNEQLREILLASTVETHKDGTAIVVEGDSSRSFYLILEGQVDVVRADPVSGQEFVVRTLDAGDEFGELSLVMNEKRSATIRANGEVCVLGLSVAALEDLRDESGDDAYSHLMYNLANQIGEKLIRTDEVAVDTLRAELERARDQVAMAQFIVFVTVVMTIYAFSTAFVGLAEDNLFIADTFSNLSILVSIGAFVWLVVRSPYKLDMFGLSIPKNLLQHIGSSLLWTAGFMVVSTAIKWVMIQAIPAYANVPLFFLPWEDYPEFAEVTAKFSISLMIAYIILSPIQEIMARGVMQGSLTKFFEHIGGKHVLAIIISNGLFAAAHLHLSPVFAVITFVIGCLWGIQFAARTARRSHAR